MTELLKAFPALWAIFGVVIASGAFLYANRFIFRWQREATLSLITTLKERIDALDAEKVDYKEKLHAEKNNHQASLLRIKELENKPDVTALFQASQEFYQKQTEVQAAQAAMMREMIQAVQKHDSDVGVRMQPIYDSLRTMGEGIAELLKRSQKPKAVST